MRILVEFVDPVTDEEHEITMEGPDMDTNELREVVLDALEIPHDVIGLEGATIMPLHTLSQFENPSFGISGINGPGSCQSRPNIRCPIGSRKIKQHQRVVQ